MTTIKPSDQAIAVDPVVEAVRAKLLERSQTGIRKYGVTLAREDLSMRDWLEHLQFELLDGANYAQRMIDSLTPLPELVRGDVITPAESQLIVDALAQEIRRVDGGHDLGAGALAEALLPFISALMLQNAQKTGRTVTDEEVVGIVNDLWDADIDYERACELARKRLECINNTRLIGAMAVVK